MKVKLNSFGRGSLAVLIVAVSVGCVDRAAQDQAKKTAQIVTDPVKPVVAQAVSIKTLTQTIEITGEVTTSNDATVGVKNPGRLTAVYVQDGDPVRRGQVIAVQDTSNQRISLQQALAQSSTARSALTQAIANMQVGPLKSSAAVRQAQAALAQAKTQLQKAINGARPEERTQASATVASAQSSMDTARKQRDRQRQLLDQGAISQAEFDTAENAFENAEAQYQSAKAAQSISQSQTRPEDIQVARDAVQQASESLKTAQAQKQLDSLYRDQVDSARAGLQASLAAVRLAQQQIQDATVVSPFDGRVSGKPTQVGTVLGAGGAVAQIIGGAGTYFEGQVSENDVANIHMGSGVSVSLDALPGRTYSGHVATISPSASTVGRLFAVRVVFDTRSNEVKPGMFARGQVIVKSIVGATVIKSSAVIQKNGENFVFVADGSKAHQVKVQLGLTQGDYVEVHGLAPGQQVITTGQSDLAEGTPIKLTPESAATAANNPVSTGA